MGPCQLSVGSWGTRLALGPSAIGKGREGGLQGCGRSLGGLAQGRSSGTGRAPVGLAGAPSGQPGLYQWDSGLPLPWCCPWLQLRWTGELLARREPRGHRTPPCWTWRTILKEAPTPESWLSFREAEMEPLRRHPSPLFLGLRLGDACRPVMCLIFPGWLLGSLMGPTSAGPGCSRTGWLGPCALLPQDLRPGLQRKGCLPT